MSFRFKNKGFKNYSYGELLRTKEWEERRFYILNRDKFRCRICDMIATEPIKMNRRWFSLGEFKLAVNNKKISLMPEVTFFDSPIVLHVHHKFYMLNRLPWEYEDDEIESLCSICHSKLHDENEIVVYLDERKIPLENLTECYRCNGDGYFDQYSHVNGGVCFRCGGTKYEEIGSHIMD